MQLYAYIKVLAHLLALCIVLWIRTVSKEIELMEEIESFIILSSAKKKKWSHEFSFCLLFYIMLRFFFQLFNE